MDRPDSYSFPELIRNKIGKYILTEKLIEPKLLKPENYSKIYVKAYYIEEFIVNSGFKYLFAIKETIKLEDVCNNYIFRFTADKNERTKLENIDYSTIKISTNHFDLGFYLRQHNYISNDRIYQLWINNTISKNMDWYHDSIYITLWCKEYESQLDAFMNPINA